MAGEASGAEEPRRPLGFDYRARPGSGPLPVAGIAIVSHGAGGGDPTPAHGRRAGGNDRFFPRSHRAAGCLAAALHHADDRTRPRKDYALRDFLDIFNHRALSLFYRAWQKYRFPFAYEDLAIRQSGARGPLHAIPLLLAGPGDGRTPQPLRSLTTRPCSTLPDTSPTGRGPRPPWKGSWPIISSCPRPSEQFQGAMASPGRGPDCSCAPRGGTQGAKYANRVRGRDWPSGSGTWRASSASAWGRWAMPSSAACCPTARCSGRFVK